MAIRKKEYKNFSFQAHRRNWQLVKPNVCELALTYGCVLHCRHCYSDCYNRPEYLARQLSTKQVLAILAKLRSAGVLWLCFTGGDPCVRQDFAEVYSCAKSMGFLVSIYTSGCSLTPRLAALLSRKPPFVVDLTLNAVSRPLYEKISQVPGSFKKAMEALSALRSCNVPVEIKTLITRDNVAETGRIRRFVEGLGLTFRPDYDLYPRLNGDTFPVTLRVPLKQRLRQLQAGIRSACGLKPAHTAPALPEKKKKTAVPFFTCNVQHSDTLIVDPFGNARFCALLGFPSFDLLTEDCMEGFRRISAEIKKISFASDSLCVGCAMRESCLNCPGNAYLETGDSGAPSAYYCNLAKMVSKA